MSFRPEKYIPYKFHDCKETARTFVFCRGVETGAFKEFSLPSGDWIIVDPFRYENETVEETTIQLKRIFQTSTVHYEGDWDRFVVSDYDEKNYDENLFKSSLVLKNNYHSKIVMNKKRFYNLFSDDGDWLDERGSGYLNMEKHHFFLFKDDEGNWYYQIAAFPHHDWKKVDFKDLTHLFEEVDLIFSLSPKKDFENDFDLHISSRVDYIYLKDIIPLEERSNQYDYNPQDMFIEWYQKNIRSLYAVSFLASRNISELVLYSDNEWKDLADDISLGLDPSLYDGRKVSRLRRYFSLQGKYTNVYFYRMGEIFLALLNKSPSPRTRCITGSLSSISNWSELMWNFFTLENLDPEKFLLPSSAIYMDKQFIVTSKKLDGIDVEPYVHDHMIVIGDGSYIVFNKKNDLSIFYGPHPLCNPHFSAVKKCIEKYVLCKAYDYGTNIDAMCRLTEKDEDTLMITVNITPRNIEDYRQFFTEKELKSFFSLASKEKDLKLWMVQNERLTRTYEKNNVIAGSTDYIRDILQQIDKI